MTKNESFNLTTGELKEALIDYVNKKTGNQFFPEEVDGFSVHQSSDDIREYSGYISIKVKVL